MSSSAGQRWILCGGANHASAPEDALLSDHAERQEPVETGAGA